MHLALVCPDMTGHLNPMTTLGRALAARGHRVTLFSLPPAERYAVAAGLGFVPIGVVGFETDIAPGRVRLAGMTGIRAMAYTGKLIHQIERIGLRELPDAFRAAGVDGVVADQVSPSGACAAAALGLPHAVACNALNLRQEPGVPPAVLGWRHRTGFLARLRNRLGGQALAFAAGPIRRTVNAYHKDHGIPDRSAPDLSFGGSAVEVAQQPAFFDFPRTRLPSHFHYTGPWHRPGRDATVPFPWEKLDGRPLVYASLGTLQNRLADVFAAILSACESLPVQVVLALGRRDATWDRPTPANAIVVPFAPQLDLLDRSALTVTHAGLNTVLEALARGVPMVCLPVTNDQPGVAERVRWLGAGEVVPPRRATADRLRDAIRRVLTDESYRTAAAACRDKLKASPGVERAAELVEAGLGRATGTR